MTSRKKNSPNLRLNAVIPSIFSNFDRLLEVVLRGEFVNDSEPKNAIANTVPNLRDLDISKCLVSSWQTVADITSQLKDLKTLNVRWEFTDNAFFSVKIAYSTSDSKPLAN